MLSAFSAFTHQYAFSVQCIYTPVCFSRSVHLHTSMLSAFSSGTRASVCFSRSVHLHTSMLSAFSAFKHQYAFSVQCIYTPLCFQRSGHLNTSMLSAFSAFTHQYAFRVQFRYTCTIMLSAFNAFTYQNAFIITMAGLHQVHDSKNMPVNVHL